MPQPISIAATATALPPHEITRDDVKRYFGSTFAIDERRLNAMMSIVDNSQVHRRWFIHPVDYIIEPRPLATLTREYQEHSILLGQQAAESCLQKAGLSPSDVDLLITTSCTGFMIPSLDAHLINRMGFRPDVRRVPITELGCAAGAAALGRSADYVRAYPDATALVVAVELPSLTFQRRDLSQANLISTILFGDGAAAAVVTGRPARGPKILEVASHLLPDTIDAMGFDLQGDGFHIILSKEVPQLIRDRIKQILCTTLARRGLTTADVSAFVLHPGGRALLQAVQDELGLTDEDTQPSWTVLRECGNQSSASVLFVLDEWLRTRQVPRGAYGMLAAFGPGFSAETALLEWDSILALPPTVKAYLAVVAAVAMLRFAELVISMRHRRALAAAGATAVHEPHFKWMAVLHAAILGGAAIEVVALHRPFVPALALPALVLLVAATWTRWWVIQTLGQHWNVGVMDSTRQGVVDTGPYRWVRHPNYTAVFVELLALPLVHSAWITAVLGGVAHVFVLRARVAAEDRVLLANTDYKARMGAKPRFFPG